MTWNPLCVTNAVRSVIVRTIWVASLIDSVNQFTQRGEHFGSMTELSVAHELSKLPAMRSTAITYAVFCVAATFYERNGYFVLRRLIKHLIIDRFMIQYELIKRSLFSVHPPRNPTDIKRARIHS